MVIKSEEKIWGDLEKMGGPLSKRMETDTRVGRLLDGRWSVGSLFLLFCFKFSRGDP